MADGLIKEIFTSIQGEALYIGQQQLFIRFCGCNLKCEYCDTGFQAEQYFYFHDCNMKIRNPITPKDLKEIIEKATTPTVSLTGGEPLVQVGFLEDFLPIVRNKKFYLETNGSMPKELEKVIKYVDVVSMDIKLECSTKQPAQFDKNEDFIEIAKKHGKEIFAKIVLNNKYDEKELAEAINIVKKYAIPLVIQPMDCKDKTLELDKNEIINLLDFTTNNYKNIRFIPQVHKFLTLM